MRSHIKHELEREKVKTPQYISLTDEIFEHVDHSHLRTGNSATTSNVYTPREHSNVFTHPSMYLCDNFEMKYSGNNSQQVPQRTGGWDYQPSQVNEDSYNETMEEIPNEIIGVPVSHHSKPCDYVSFFCTKPKFPDQVIP
jgi:hypothetical protein